jgi:serine/threonine protein kinase
MEELSKNSEWEFDESELEVDGDIKSLLGRGAYGEVRRGKWRGISVAAKRLHALAGAMGDLTEEEMYCVVNDFAREMEMLSKLRHPNLLLFLGVAFESESALPKWIITELMSKSLYNVIHDDKVSLTFSQVVNIALHVGRGLVYLHELAIIHRDISSKNVLLDGSRVVIADLGQAKAFNSTLTRATSMPGAYVYSAPEVLTGSYTPMIDIFSLGVLLVQCICGRYPSIEKRMSDIQESVRKFPQLEPLIRSMMDLDPTKRPTAGQVVSILEGLQTSNDGYANVGYGCGVLNEIWLSQSIAKALKASEADIREAAAKEMGEMHARIEALQDLVRKESEKRERVEQDCAQLINAMAATQRESDAYRERAQDTEARLISSNVLIESLQNQLNDLDGRMKTIGARMMTERKGREEAESMLTNCQHKLEAAHESRKLAEINAVHSQEELAQVGSKIDALEKVVKERDHTIECLNQELLKEGTRMGLLESTLKELHIRFDSMVTSNKHMEGEIKRYEAQRATDQKNMKYNEELLERAKRQQSLALTELPKLPEVDGEEAGGKEYWSCHTCTFVNKTASSRCDACDSMRKGSKGHAPLSAITAASEVGNNNVIQSGNKVTLPSITGTSNGVTVNGGNERKQSLQKQLNLAVAGNAELHVEVTAGATQRDRDNTVEGNGGARKLPESADRKSLIEKAQHDGMSSIVELMELYSDDVEIQYRGCQAFKSLAYSTVQSRSVSTDLKAVTASLRGLSKFPNSVEMQNHGIGSLMNLSYNNDHVKDLINTSNGIQLIIEAMKMYPSNADIQNRACGAVANVSYNNDKAKVEVASKGGIRQILNTMSNFAHDAVVLQRACWALLTLASNDELAVEIVTSGGIERIISGMRNCLDDAKLCQYACWGLANLAWNEQEIRLKALKLGADVAVENALRKHASKREVTEKAVLALGKMRSTS